MDNYEVYTDGSYQHGVCSWAFVVVKNGDKIAAHSGVVNGEPGLLRQQNVAAEMKAAMAAVCWLDNQQVKGAHIRSDFEGVQKWPQGHWSTNNYYTESYAEYMREKRNVLAFSLDHVKAHSGNKWNEMADSMAKARAKKASSPSRQLA